MCCDLPCRRRRRLLIEDPVREVATCGRHRVHAKCILILDWGQISLASSSASQPAAALGAGGQPGTGTIVTGHDEQAVGKAGEVVKEKDTAALPRRRTQWRCHLLECCVHIPLQSSSEAEEDGGEHGTSVIQHPQCRGRHTDEEDGGGQGMATRRRP